MLCTPSLSVPLSISKPPKRKCKCLPDEIFDETKDGRGDSLRVAVNEIERCFVEGIVAGHAAGQARR